MATTKFTRAELQANERFMAQVAKENVPDGDFAEGTALRDLAIRASSAITMYMRSELEDMKILTDLSKISQIEDETEKGQALDAFATNKFMPRNGGGQSRGFIEVSFTTAASGVVPVGNRFMADSLVYIVDAASPFIFDATDLLTVIASGVTRFILRLPVVAVDIGEGFNIDARVFTSWDVFHPDITRVESLDTFSGGAPTETVDEYLLRVEESITVRNLLTSRAINTVLPKEFPEISQLHVVEAGAVEMTRDIAPLPGGGPRIHTGGSTDIFVFTNVTTKTAEQVVGGATTDASGVLDTFRDLDLDNRGVDWRGLVKPGDVLRVTSSSSAEPTILTIVEVDSFYLRVHTLIPFVEAKPVARHSSFEYTGVSSTPSTDTLTISVDTTQFTTADIESYVYVYDTTHGEFFRIVSLGAFVDGVATSVVVDDPTDLLSGLAATDLNVQVFDDRVTYSIGDNYPTYNNKIDVRPFGQITRTVRSPGRILLPSEPLYRITEVVLLDPTDPLADPIVGGVLFDDQVLVAPAPGAAEFQVLSNRLHHAQSTQASTQIRVGPEDAREGVQGAFSAPTSESATFTDATTTFTVADVGAHILVTKARSAINAGLFRITAFLSPTSVTVVKDVGSFEFVTVVLVAEANMTWEFERRYQYDNRSLRVRYESLMFFSSIAAFIESSDERIVASSPLTRAPHPVYVGFSLLYQLQPTASVDIDTDAAVRALVTYVNEFPAFDVLNVGDIVQQFRTLYFEEVGNVLQPMLAEYFLISPDGGKVFFESNDEIVMKTSLAKTATDAGRLAVAMDHGVSDHTIKYLSAQDLITVTRV